jgi:hypothetical protein
VSTTILNNDIILFFLQLIRKSAVKIAQTIPAIKNTPLKLNAEKIGLNMMGGKN